MPIKVAYCVWVLKSSVTSKGPLPRSWGHRQESTAAPIMLNLLEKVFGDRVSSPQWQATLKAIVPSYGRKLNGDVAATERELQYTSEVLGLKYDKPQAADSTPKPQLKPPPLSASRLIICTRCPVFLTVNA